MSARPTHPSTPLTDAAGIEVPLLCGAMYPCSNPELVAAVSEAGGLGVLQPISLTWVHGYDFREGVRLMRRLTSKPIGMNALIEQSSRTYRRRMERWIDVALEEGVRFFVTSLGNPRWVVDRVRPVGGVVYHDVTELKWGQKGKDAGVEGLIAVNDRAGGHAGGRTAEALLGELAELDLPLVCAGGIGDEQDFARVLAMGYAGAQLGTRFIATGECQASAGYKQAIVDADESSVVLTERLTGVPVSVLDTPSVRRLGTRVGPIARWMLRGRRTKHWMRTLYALRSLWQLKRGLLRNAPDRDYWQAGKSVSGIHRIEPAGDIVRRFAKAFLRATAVAVVLAMLPGCRRTAPPYDNVVLVTIDTLRADHLGVYGYPRPTSPYLDQLGREGVVFWHAVAASSHTAPSHATILTALYPEQHRVLVNGQELDPQIPALAGIVRDAGFETAGFVSVRFLAGLRTGFDVFDADVTDGEVFRTADGTVDRAIAWLRERDPGRRFALWVHVYDPHQHVVTTRMPEPEYRLMQEDSARRGKELLYFLQQEQGYPHDELSGAINRYDAQVAFVDRQIRRLFEAVAEAAPESRTLRVITADHGEGLGNHGLEGHGKHLYQEQVRAPLILHGDTERLRHTVVTSLVRHVDVLPTVAELLGVPLSRSQLRLEGVSLVPLLEKPSADLGIETAFSQRRPPDERRLAIGWEPGIKLSAQDATHKFILNPEPPHEFYDLERDPNELHNLIHAPDPRKDRLETWLREKYEALARDHRTEERSDEIDPQVLEDLKALGYI